eukprot:1613107-Rhodomonas_salina.3
MGADVNTVDGGRDDVTPLLNAASAGSRYRPARLKAKKKRRKVGVRRVQSVPVSAQIVYGASDCVLCVRRYKCASRACSTSGRKSTKRCLLYTSDAADDM